MSETTNISVAAEPPVAKPYDRLAPVIDTKYESPDECECFGGYPCACVPSPLIYVSTPYFAYLRVTMDMADRLDQAGLYGVADLARKYAVDRPRWWHRFTRSDTGRSAASEKEPFDA